ncbi:MAG: ATP synthase F1 subunit gamma [Alphaproteobacteria bacterium]|nr:ATP synthase F1 subunit gamma [Alphaproteobacteria bacterium]
MANLRDIKTRISSVQKTRQITAAMKLVAAAKLNRATQAATAARPYREQLQAVLGRVAGATTEDDDEPLLQSRAQVRTVQAVILTSDKGLCGPFNNGLMRKFEDWYQKRKAAGQEVTIRVFGRKGRDYLRARGYTVEQVTLDVTKADKMVLVRPLSEAMVSGFIEQAHDETVLIYNRFVNTLVQEPTFETILPLSVEETDHDVERLASGDYRYEPGAGEIIGNLLPLYLRTLVLQAFLENDAGFYAAQMTAMDNATKNAGELINDLTLEFNRARQAAITTEIIEITSGAAALE